LPSMLPGGCVAIRARKPSNETPNGFTPARAGIEGTRNFEPSKKKKTLVQTCQ
jgi:hypothetical protein